MSIIKAPEQQMEYLNGLRGLAALVVVLHHFTVGFYPAIYNGVEKKAHILSYPIEVTISKTPLDVIFSGNFAVCIFFVLSGYVLTYKYFKIYDLEILTSGAVRRYFRLALPILFSLVLAYIFMKLNFFHNQEAALITKSDWWLATFWTFPPNFYLMLKEALWGVLLKKEYSYNTILWTMNYEFIGSMLAFSLAAIIGNVRHKYWIYALIAFLFFFDQTNYYYSAFVLGVMLGDMYSKNINVPILNNKISILLLLVSGLFLGSYPFEANVEGTFYWIMKLDVLQNPGAEYHVLGAFFIMLALLNSKKLQAFFSKSPFIFLGKISFSLYLIHLIFICSFSSYIFVFFKSFVKYNTAFALTFVLSLPLLMTASWVVYKLVDSKSVLLSKILYKNLFGSTNNVEIGKAVK
jgi:peptidoglycan/LPS O-acetylase OafA/YrhL